jgi:zinc transport system substrate-binding protein
MRTVSLVLGLAVAAWGFVFMAGCGERAERAREPGAVRVVVSVPPLAGLVRALAPPEAEVRVLVPAGSSPHGYEPTPAEMAAVGRADLVVLVGMGIESGLPEAVRHGPRALSMGGALGLDGGDHGHHHHDHGPDGACEHEGEDPHLWLDPTLVEAFAPRLARGIERAMERAGASPEERALVGERLEGLLERVRGVDEAYRQRLSPHEGAVVITQHDAWSRLFDRYGLVVASWVQPAEDAEPSAGHMAELVKTAGARGVVAVLTEPQLNHAVARRLAAQIGVPLAEIDPLGSGDWEALMLRNLEALEGVLATAGESPAG